MNRPPILALALLLLGACSVLPERVPITVYQPMRTDAAPAEVARWPQAKWSLLVAEPVAGQVLDSDGIAVRPSPGVLQVYKGASWSDPAPNLIHTALVRRLEDSGKILSVARPGGGVRGDYQLQTELRAFESVYAQPGQPQAVVELYAKLVHNGDGEVVAARNFREVEAVGSEATADVVQALSRAMARLTTQVAGWTLASGEQHEAAK